MLNSNVNLKEYMPDIYKDVVESETQQESLSIEMNKLHNRVQQAMNDQFIQYASIKAIVYYESIFNIIANPATESLQFRRDRVMSRMKRLRPPYSYYYLRRILDGFFGAGNYILDIQNDDYLISLQSSSKDSAWYHEVRVAMNNVKPCNLIFENVPLVDTNLLMNETIVSNTSTRNYRLDGTWKLGIKPFVSRSYEEIRKMADTPSIQDEFILKSLNYWTTIIDKFVINDSVEITNFTTEVEDNILTIEYPVQQEATSMVNNIKIYDTENKILSNVNVYIPVEDYVIIKHRIKLEEGINE